MQHPKPRPTSSTPEGIAKLADLATRSSLAESGEYRVVGAVVFVECVHKPGLRSCPPPVETYEATPSGSWKQVGS